MQGPDGRLYRLSRVQRRGRMVEDFTVDGYPGYTVRCRNTVLFVVEGSA